MKFVKYKGYSWNKSCQRQCREAEREGEGREDNVHSILGAATHHGERLWRWGFTGRRWDRTERTAQRR